MWGLGLGLGVGAALSGAQEPSRGSPAEHGVERTPEGAQEASMRQDASLVDARARVWELHVRGVSRVRIAREVGVHRQTVGRWLATEYAALEREGKVKREQELTMAVARLRHIQQQAWEDHDADDERERVVLAPVIGEGDGEREDREASAKKAKREERSSEGRGERDSAGRGMARYQSQRAQYLRVILDAEREIARLLGLYEKAGATEGTVVFRLERVAEGG